MFGYNDIVKLLLNNGADINARDNYGNTAIDSAGMVGQRETIELLKKWSSYE